MQIKINIIVKFVFLLFLFSGITVGILPVFYQKGFYNVNNHNTSNLNLIYSNRINFYRLSQNTNVDVNETISLSTNIKTYLEYDFMSKSYYDQTHKISATFYIIGINNTITIDVTKDDRVSRMQSGFPPVISISTIDSIKVSLEHKKNHTSSSYSISPNNPLQINSYGEYLFQFKYSYSYSYTSCSRHDTIYCEDTVTRTAEGVKSTDPIDFKPVQGNSINGYNLMILYLMIGSLSLITIKIKKK